MFYKFLLFIILFFFVSCNIVKTKVGIPINNEIKSNVVIYNPEDSFVLKWKIEKNVITYIPKKIKDQLKIRCINYSKTVLTKIYTSLDDIVEGTFECRLTKVNY